MWPIGLDWIGFLYGPKRLCQIEINELKEKTRERRKIYHPGNMWGEEEQYGLYAGGPGCSDGGACPNPCKSIHLLNDCKISIQLM
jgi:hypothetical protein